MEDVPEDWGTYASLDERTQQAIDAAVGKPLAEFEKLWFACKLVAQLGWFWVAYVAKHLFGLPQKSMALKQRNAWFAITLTLQGVVSIVARCAWPQTLLPLFDQVLRCKVDSAHPLLNAVQIKRGPLATAASLGDAADVVLVVVNVALILSDEKMRTRIDIHRHPKEVSFAIVLILIKMLDIVVSAVGLLSVDFNGSTNARRIEYALKNLAGKPWLLWAETLKIIADLVWTVSLTLYLVPFVLGYWSQMSQTSMDHHESEESTLAKPSSHVIGRAAQSW